MKGKKKAKNLTLISAIISLIAFVYKISLAYLTTSQVLFIASISTLMVFICKVLFVKNVTKTREKKKKAYLIMLISVLIYSLIFIAFVVFKINGIDLSNDKTYEGIYGTLFILFLIIIFILSLIGLKGALNKTDLMVIGLKEMAFISVLADSVIIEEFVSRIILEYKNIDVLETINNYYSLGIGILMLFISICMLFRFLKYDKKI